MGGGVTVVGGEVTVVGGGVTVVGGGVTVVGGGVATLTGLNWSTATEGLEGGDAVRCDMSEFVDVNPLLPPYIMW